MRDTVSSNSELRISIDPPLLTPWLIEKQREMLVVLLNLQVDQDVKGLTRFDLDVVFDPISIRERGMTRRDFYVGSTGAEISIHVDSIPIVEFTPSVNLSVDYRNNISFHRQSNLSLIPKVKYNNSSGTIVSAELGHIQYQKKQQVDFSANFRSEERLLESIHLSDTIKWNISLPRGEKVIRDFLLGNLYLYAKCNNRKKTKLTGYIEVRPSNVIFFNSQRKPIESFMKRLYMHYLLYKEGIVIDYVDGVRLNFSQK